MNLSVTASLATPHSDSGTHHGVPSSTYNADPQASTIIGGQVLGDRHEISWWG